MCRSQNPSMGTFRFEITGLLCCEFRYRHRHFQVLEGPKITSMIVLRDINCPLSGCLYAATAHTGINSLSREHEGTLTQTELAITMQIPLNEQRGISGHLNANRHGRHVAEIWGYLREKITSGFTIKITVHPIKKYSIYPRP